MWPWAGSFFSLGLNFLICRMRLEEMVLRVTSSSKSCDPVNLGIRALVQHSFPPTHALSFLIHHSLSIWKELNCLISIWERLSAHKRIPLPWSGLVYNLWSQTSRWERHNSPGVMSICSPLIRVTFLASFQTPQRPMSAQIKATMTYWILGLQSQGQFGAIFLFVAIRAQPEVLPSHSVTLLYPTTISEALLVQNSYIQSCGTPTLFLSSDYYRQCWSF